MRTILLILLAGCHATCGDNYAHTYARALDNRVACRDIVSAPTLSGDLDFAVCSIEKERWLCSGNSVETSVCYPVGSEPVSYTRAHPTPEASP